jgi:hypothetical protein
MCPVRCTCVTHLVFTCFHSTVTHTATCFSMYLHMLTFWFLIIFQFIFWKLLVIHNTSNICWILIIASWYDCNGYVHGMMLWSSSVRRFIIIIITWNVFALSFFVGKAVDFSLYVVFWIRFIRDRDDRL